MAGTSEEPRGETNSPDKCSEQEQQRGDTQEQPRDRVPPSGEDNTTTTTTWPGESESNEDDSDAEVSRSSLRMNPQLIGRILLARRLTDSPYKLCVWALFAAFISFF